MQVYLKPHHALCIILFSESGHSTPYVSIMREHIGTLSEYPKTEVVLTSDFDAICGHCPHKNNLVCDKSDEVDLSDEKILSYCGIKFGRRYAWDDLRRKMMENILCKSLLGDVCKGCMYLPRCRKNILGLTPSAR